MRALLQLEEAPRAAAHILTAVGAPWLTLVRLGAPLELAHGALETLHVRR